MSYENRFIASSLFHEFVPKQRLTRWGWFGYLGVRIKVSWEDALLNVENGVSSLKTEKRRNMT
jgi:hypothetical protein